jgi:hypothetical protein
MSGLPANAIFAKQKTINVKSRDLTIRNFVAKGAFDENDSLIK